MARLRDALASSTVEEDAVPITLMAEVQGPVVWVDWPAAVDAQPAVPGTLPLHDGRLGEILARRLQLTPQEVERIAAVARVRLHPPGSTAAGQPRRRASRCFLHPPHRLRTRWCRSALPSPS